MNEAPSLSVGILARVFWRSLFIQAGFSPESMQSLGLIYALQPAFAVLYPDERERAEAVKRHLVPFNTHPYVAAAILGGILFHEARIASGNAAPDTVDRFKSALMGPLAALGDGFFWLSLRPAASALAAVLVPVIGLWSALVFALVYNAVHFSARGWLFLLGKRHGDALVSRLLGAKLPFWGSRLRTFAAACVGVSGAWLALRFGAQVGGHTALSPAIVALGGGALTVALVERRVSPYWALYGLAGVAVLAGALM
jgi:PTS system mannose-specific IID component